MLTFGGIKKKNKMNKKYTLLTLLLGLILVSSCGKWTDPTAKGFEKDALDALYENRDKPKWDAEDARDKENKEAYEQYLRNLRAYKETEHPIMFGWFNAWQPEAPGPYSKLSLLPDSMDVVSIWGNCFNLSEERIKELRNVQSKGTKVVFGWIIEHIGDQIRWGEDWEVKWDTNDKYEAIEMYAQAIMDTVAKYDYDGFDYDYEPSYSSPFKPGNHCGNLTSCSSSSGKQWENHFMKTMREKLDAYGELKGKKMLFHLNGSIHWLDPSSAKYFDRFVVQSYNGNFGAVGSVEGIASRLNVSPKQIVFTESFEGKPHNRPTFVSKYAKYVTDRDNNLGGIGVYHINEDTFNNDNYRHVRAAISTMNPPIR